MIKNSAKKPASRRWSLRILALSLALLFAFVVGEVAARVVSEVDADGNVIFRTRWIPRYRPPAQRVKQKIKKYDSSTDKRIDAGAAAQETRNGNSLADENAAPVHGQKNVAVGIGRKAEFGARIGRAWRHRIVAENLIVVRRR